MNEQLLTFLCCSKCHSHLTKREFLLHCVACNKDYQIIEGIPIFVDFRHLGVYYQSQINYFDKERKERKKFIISSWQKSYLERISRHFQLNYQDKILIDVGTGSGWVAINAAKKGFLVIACDLTLPNLIELKKIAAKLGLKDRILPICCNAENLPVKKNTADFLVSTAVLEHLPREKEAIREIDRVCKRKSKLFITVPIKFKYIWPFFWLINFIHDKRIGHLRRYDLKSLNKKFKPYGFRPVKTYYTGHLIKTIGVLISKLLKTNKLDQILERVDKKKENKAYGVNNISVVFER